MHCGAVVVIEVKARPMAGAGMAVQNWDYGHCPKWTLAEGCSLEGGLTLGKAASFKWELPGRMQL